MHAQRRLAEAIDYYQRSLAINEEHHQVRGVALLRCYLGYALDDHGDPAGAIESFRCAADTAASISDHHCQAQALVGVGTVHARQGRLQLAIAELTKGLAALTAPAADGQVQLLLGRSPIDLPPRLAELAVTLVVDRRHGRAALGQAADHAWLFPGSRPGTHLSSRHSTSASSPSASMRGPRATPPCSISPPSCPPRCSAACSALASPPPPPGPTTPATAPATPPNLFCDR